jgi:hypothetical protein
VVAGADADHEDAASRFDDLGGFGGLLPAVFDEVAHIGGLAVHRLVHEGIGGRRHECSCYVIEARGRAAMVAEARVGFGGRWADRR